MNKLLRNSQRFLKKNSATILTTVGAVGVVATAVTTAKAATKASYILDQAEQLKEEKLTFEEKIKIAGPMYVPAIMIGAATITCIFGANHLNKRKQASLIGAYTMLDQSYKNYKNKVKEIYGVDGYDKVIEEIVKDDIQNAPKSYEPEEELFYDLYSGRYFNNTLENVLKAESEINKLMHTDCGVGVNEFYKLIGLDELPELDEVGWTSCMMQDMYWHPWVEFDHKKVFTDDGLECVIIEIPLEPIVDYFEY